ncbi:hypothetical protein Tco_0558321 [Tanacetum coccineum]
MLPVTLSTGLTKTKVLVTSSSHSSDLAAKFLNFSDIPHTDAEIVSPMDVHVHHEVPSKKTPTLLTVPILVITDTSPVYSTVIPQSLPSFAPSPHQSTSTPPPTNEAINPLFTLPNFASVFQFNNRVTTLEKEVVELKKDPLHTQAIALVDDHLDTRLGVTRDEFMNFLSAPLTARITEQVKNQLPQILSEEVSNSPPLVIQKMVQESLENFVLAKQSSQPQSLYEAATKLTEFELKKILVDIMDKKPKEIRKEVQARAEPTKGPKAKESQSGSSKGTKSQSKSFGKSVQSKEPEFEVAYSDMPQDQEVNLGNDDEEPKEKVASKRDWFTKPTQPQEPTDPDWNVDKTLQQGQNQSWLMTLASSDQCSDAKLEYDFKECYKALSEKLDWENTEGGDYPFDLTKPLPLVMSGNHQKVPVDYFFDNDLKYLQGGISTMTYTTSLTKTKAAQYDLPGIEDMVPNIWSPVKVAYDKHAL